MSARRHSRGDGSAGPDPTGQRGVGLSAARGGAGPARTLGAALLLAWLASGCAGPGEIYEDERGFRERAQRKEANGLIVETAALSRNESEAEFGVALNDLGVQPVWLKITNRRAEPHWLYPIEIDRDYFPPFEVASRSADAGKETVDDLYYQLLVKHVALFIPPHGFAQGFVYAHADEGLKAFNVELHGPRSVQQFSFVVPVPGLPTQYFALSDDVSERTPAHPALDEQALWGWLEQAECCTRNGEGRQGDPLNIVLVGSLDQVRAALVSRDWDVTAPVNRASLLRTVSAFLFGSRYRYAPISSLYVFGREQDLAFQKARAVIDERNHLRLWLAPVTFEGRPVWIGQISRDVGVKLSGRLWPPTTHVIDPDVDDARFYLLQDLSGARAIARLGFARGHEEADLIAPHVNAEDDPYFTDGLRAVFFLADPDRPVPTSEIQLLDWRLPPVMETFRRTYMPPR